MSLLSQKLTEYKEAKLGTKESQDIHKEMCNIYNNGGYTPKLRSTCYCNRTTNLKYIEKICS